MHFTKMKLERMKLLHLKRNTSRTINGIMSRKRKEKKTKLELCKCYLLRNNSEHTGIGI